MRKLASIQRIERIDPIPSCDNIGLAKVEGWQVIVRYDQFEPGDLCVYFEIDSLLPEKEVFEFMRPKSFRVKTMKMRGVFSQGLCMPLSILPPNTTYLVGDDVTDILGVTKYEPPTEAEHTRPTPAPKNPILAFFNRLFRRKKCPAEGAPFPDFVSKTDETRVENMPWVLKKKDISFEAHEKVDGQSGTFFYRKQKRFGIFPADGFGVCSRNYRWPKPDNSSYWAVAKRYRLRTILPAILRAVDDGSSWICLQGECIGPGIQQNKYHLTSPDLYCFNLITEKSGKLDSLWAAELVADFGLTWVPLICEKYTLPDTVDELRSFVHGDSKLYPTLREGIVFRNYSHNLSFKCVDPAYLIKWKE